MAAILTADCCLVTGDLPLLGFGLPVSGRWATPDTMRRIARRAEELGYASLWTFQRVLYPVGGALGPAHESVLDPVVPLAYVAGHTDRIRLGTATDLRAVHGARAAREDADVAGRAVRRPAHRGSRDGLAAGGVRRRRRALRAARRADGRVPALPGGAVDAGPCRVRRRVLHRAALARGPAARATTAPPGAAGRRRRAGAAPRRAARPGLDRQQPAGPHRARRVDRDGARRRARGRARPGGGADRGARRRRPGRRGSWDPRRPLHGTREQVLDDLAALRAQGVTEVFLDLNLSPGSTPRTSTPTGARARRARARGVRARATRLRPSA